jgi:uncharacterized repeat protein (TIGR01451 family)
MRGRYVVVALALLAAGLAGWAARAEAQTDPPKPLSDPELMATGGQVSGPSVPQPPGAPGVALPAVPGALPAVSSGPSVPALPPASLPGADPGKPVGVPSSSDGPAAPAIEDHSSDSDQGGNTGRQDPSVSLEWIGSVSAKVGVPTDYTVAVRNTCNIPVQQVLVRVRMPVGMTVNATEPRAAAEGNVLVWDLGTMLPKQEKNLQMKVQCDSKGDLAPQAWVTFTGSSLMHVVVREPRLHLRASAVEKVMIGDTVSFGLTVTNPGDGPADQVKIQATLSEGLEHPKGNRVEVNVGKLNPGETRSIQVICAARAGGPQKCDGLAVAEGGLQSAASASVNVIMPRLDLVMSGPGKRYLDRKATYTIKVINPGDAPATNVSVNNVIPPGFKFISAADGGQHDFNTRTVSWFLGEVGPGQTREVKFEVLAISPGTHKQKATATAARGLTVEGECVTQVEGVSALLTELVDTEDPIEVGADTSYEIRITNTGSKTENDIKLLCVVPEKMQFKNAQGPCRFVQQGNTIVFEPLPKLAPRADAIFRVMVKGMDAGSVLFKIQVTSASIPEPIVRTESTTIYSDAPEGK